MPAMFMPVPTARPPRWAALFLCALLIMLGGAAIRQFFVVRHRFKLGNAGNPLPYAMVGVVVLGLSIVWMRPEPAAAPVAGAAAAQKVAFGDVKKVLEQRCYMCHGAQVQMKNATCSGLTLAATCIAPTCCPASARMSDSAANDPKRKAAPARSR